MAAMFSSTTGVPVPKRRAPGWLLVPVLGSLAGCGGGQEHLFAPECPQTAILRDAGDLRRFRGAGRDLTDLVLEGRITGLEGKCTWAPEDDTVVTTVKVGLELGRGPAAPSRAAEIAYFVAVRDGERILDKQVYTLWAEFPPNTDRVRLRGDSVELTLPSTKAKSAGAYHIDIGFQLTPDELDANRRRQR